MNATATTVRVAVHTPSHSGVGDLLDYLSTRSLPPGTLVRVPLGQREVLGLVWDAEGASPPPPGRSLRPVAAVLDGLAPLDAHWRRLVAFAARYYQRSLGEVALSALPPQLRDLSPVQLARRLRRSAPPQAPATATDLIALSAEQESAKAEILSKPGPFLLYGSTGSGKTEVYLRCVQELLEHDPAAQALVMVPEINLTPQLEERFAARFGAQQVVSLHSGMTNPQRLAGWLAAHAGHARIVLGTRMAVFASMPGLALIIVDEEHDPSYKQQEGARYSARDLAVWRGREQGAKVVLGSATPSLESWHASRPPTLDDPVGGRYQRLCMPSRIGAGELARVRRVDMNHQPRGTVFSAPLLAALQERVARGEQSMVLLNRRGYAPVLHCQDCGWKSDCAHCSAHQVFHKIDRTLRCHHCGAAQRVPRACPACGSPDIVSLGRGTEQLEEQLTTLLTDVRRPDGTPVRIARIDADSTRAKGALQSQLAQVHAGEVDVLVGTQMIAKGHDFRRWWPPSNPTAPCSPATFARPSACSPCWNRPQAAPGATPPTWPRRARAARCGCSPSTRSTPCSRRCERTTTRRLPPGNCASGWTQPCRRLPSRPWCAPMPVRRRWPKAFCVRQAAPHSRLRCRASNTSPFTRPCRWPCNASPTWSARKCCWRARAAPPCSAFFKPGNRSCKPRASTRTTRAWCAGWWMWTRWRSDAERPKDVLRLKTPPQGRALTATAGTVRGPPRSAGSVPVPEARSEPKESGSGAAAQRGVPCSIRTTRCAS